MSFTLSLISCGLLCLIVQWIKGTLEIFKESNRVIKFHMTKIVWRSTRKLITILMVIWSWFATDYMSMTTIESRTDTIANHKIYWNGLSLMVIWSWFATDYMSMTTIESRTDTIANHKVYWNGLSPNGNQSPLQTGVLLRYTTSIWIRKICIYRIWRIRINFCIYNINIISTQGAQKYIYIPHFETRHTCMGKNVIQSGSPIFKCPNDVLNLHI